ncbi:hyaluronan-binding 2-like protein [Labeo rohita]|uniref:trypsin n=1 Tax=Labeo rohita TaxID=84645 RepID=A0A498LPN2_LABRO|nr:hyaluronan-binding 2-like protein [Labeo rohita]
MFPVILLLIGLSGLTLPVQAAPGLLDDVLTFDEVCDPNPCQNNGVCEVLESGSFKCTCKEPYIGKNCQDERNVCKKVKCGHGDCVRTLEAPFYECKCHPPYGAPSCKKGPNDCYEGNGESYRGFASETVEKLECLPWNYYRIPFKEFEGNESIGAHNYCSNENEEVRVEMGGVNLEKDNPTKQFLEVEKIIVHENYTETSEALYNDIALLKLKAVNGRCANETRSVRAACLPTDSFPDETVCTISGYGATEKEDAVSPHLLDAKVLLISQKRCMSRNVYGNRMDDSMMCAGYMQGKTDSCQGDSGGPLVCQKDETHYIYGVVSWGDRCGKKNRPGIYARVTKFINWINEKMHSA